MALETNKKISTGKKKTGTPAKICGYTQVSLQGEMTQQLTQVLSVLISSDGKMTHQGKKLVHVSDWHSTNLDLRPFVHFYLNLNPELRAKWTSEETTVYTAPHFHVG